MTHRTMCATVLLIAVLFRLAAQVPWGQTIGPMMLFLGMGVTGQEPVMPEAEEATVIPRLEYTPMRSIYFSGEDAETVAIRNQSGIEISKEAMLLAPLSFRASAEGPLVLIVHTHGSEAYTMTENTQYEESSAYRTMDKSCNVVRVGAALAEALNNRGIYTLHDTTLNDIPGYDDAYTRTAALIEEYLTQYPSIQMVIDVHRDAAESASGQQLPVLTELQGQQAAQLMLVMGTNASGLEHPNWEDNLSLAVKLQALAERNAPGLFREMSLRSQRYNQHLTPNSILLEVGTAGNTLPEALISAEYIGNVLADLLTDGTVISP